MNLTGRYGEDTLIHKWPLISHYDLDLEAECLKSSLCTLSQWGGNDCELFLSSDKGFRWYGADTNSVPVTFDLPLGPWPSKTFAFHAVSLRWTCVWTNLRIRQGDLKILGKQHRDEKMETAQVTHNVNVMFAKGPKMVRSDLTFWKCLKT